MSRALENKMARYAAMPLLLAVLLMLASMASSHKQPDRVGECANIPGYDVLPNTGTNPDTGCRANSTTSVATAADFAQGICNGDPECKGFAFSIVDGFGRVNACTRPTITRPGSCLYTKRTVASCNSTASKGYTKISDALFSPFNEEFEGVFETTPDMLQHCNGDAFCFYGGYSRDYGVNFDMVRTAGLVPSVGSCAYQKVIASCPFVPGYNAQIDMNLEGSDISTMPANSSVASVAAACKSNNLCKGFNSLGKLKSAISPLAYTRGVCFYSKSPPRPPTGCPAVSGFSVSYNRDQVGYTLGQLEGNSPSQLAEACAKTSTCRGFNTLGELKQSVSSLTSVDGVCIYTMLTTACKPIAGYDTLMDMGANPYSDSPMAYYENDMNAALAYCQENQGCVSFNSMGLAYPTFREAVAVVSDGETVFTYRGVCTYVKVQPACPIVYGYAAASDTDVTGNTITTYSTILAAKAACEKLEGCKAFNSKGALKSSADPVQYVRGSCLYVKVPTTCPVVPGYKTIPDANVLNATLRNFRNVSDAIAYCDSSSRCQGVSRLNAFIQAEPVGQPVVYSRGACYYDKNTGCADIAGYKAIPGYEPTAISLQVFRTYGSYDDVTEMVDDCTMKGECAGLSIRPSTDPNTEQAIYVVKISNDSDVTGLGAVEHACYYTKVQTVCREIRRGWEVETDRIINGGVFHTDSLAHNWFGCAIDGINTADDPDTYPPCFGIDTDFNVGLGSNNGTVYKHGACYWYKTTWVADDYTSLLSQGQPAYGSSTAPGYSAAMAVDGITDVPANGWVSQNSTEDTDLFLSVDLGDVWGITRTVVYNRIECCKNMLGADDGSRIYYTNQTLTSRWNTTALDVTTIEAGLTVDEAQLLGNSDLLEIVLETNKWEATAPGVARWVILHKKIWDISALAGNVTLGTPEFQVYGIALPKLFRDDLPLAQRLNGY